MFGRLGLLLGGMATVAVVLAVSASVAWAAKSNDDFRAATRVRSLPYTAQQIDTTNATKEDAEPQPQCLIAAGKDVSQSVWYRIDVGADDAGGWSFDTRGSTYDTVLTLYRAPDRGKASFGSLDTVDCNDDNFLGTTTSQAWLIQTLTPGRYYVQIGDYDAPSLDQPHTLSFKIGPPPTQ